MNEAFEKWYSEKFIWNSDLFINKVNSDDYLDNEVNDLWLSFKAGFNYCNKIVRTT